jgi:hypothetical protein
MFCKGGRVSAKIVRPHLVDHSLCSSQACDRWAVRRVVETLCLKWNFEPGIGGRTLLPLLGFDD